MRDGATIAGRFVQTPGVYYDPNDDGMVNNSGDTPERTLLIIGTSTGGASGEVLTLKPGDETRVLQSGVGAQMAAAAFTHGLSRLLYLSPTLATRASIDLGRVILEAKNPGRPGRGVQVNTVPSDTHADAFNLYVRDAQGILEPEAYKDLGPVAEITYMGEGNPGLTVDNANGIVTYRLSDGDEQNAFEASSDQLLTFSDLVNALNHTDIWSARLVGDGSFPLTAFDPQKPDGTPVAAFTAKKVTLSIGVNALVYVLADSKLIRVQSGDATKPLRLNGMFEFLKNGADAPEPTTADWVNALRKAEKLDVQGVVLGTSNPAAHAAVAAHVQAMTDMLAQRERTTAFGLGAQPSEQAFYDLSRELALTYSDLRLTTCIGNQPFQADLRTGQVVEQPTCVAAAALMALRFNQEIAEPTTVKRLRFPRWKYDWDQDQVTGFLEAGVMPIAYNKDAGGVVITKGITTYTLDGNKMRRSQAHVEIDLYIGRLARKTLFGLSIGHIADEARINTIEAAMKSMLNSETRTPQRQRGVLSKGIDKDGKERPAFENLTLVFGEDGIDVLGIDVDAHPVGEIGFVRFSPRWSALRLRANG